MLGGRRGAAVLALGAGAAVARRRAAPGRVCIGSVRDRRSRLAARSASVRRDDRHQALPSTRASSSSTRQRSSSKNLSRNTQLVLVLDDLNWADADSLQLLEFVSRELADAAILLVGTYRDVELSRRHPLSQTIGELARERISSGFCFEDCHLSTWQIHRG
jgi:hypothetical protein